MLNQLVIVRINSTYRASVYDLQDLKRYVKENPDQVDYKLFAVEDRINEHHKNTQYLEHKKNVKEWVDATRKAHFDPPLAHPSRGALYSVHRNQAARTATCIFNHDGCTLICYAMPNGKLFFNWLGRNPDHREGQYDNEEYQTYKTITFDGVLKLVKGNHERYEALMEELKLHQERIDDGDFGNTRDGLDYWKMRNMRALISEMIVKLTEV